MELGKAIKQMRNKTGLNQQKFAALIEVNQSHLCQIELGKKKPSISLLENICKITQTPLPFALWFSLNEDDIREEKRDLYKALKGSVNSLIKELM